MEAQEIKNQIIWETTNIELNSFGDKNKEIEKTNDLGDRVYVAPWHVYDQPS